jgi:hypothetical protein
MNNHQVTSAQGDQPNLFHAGREFAMRTHLNTEQSWSDARTRLERQRDHLLNQVESYVSGMDSYIAEQEQRLFSLEVNTAIGRKD